jgi:NAD/NADP transhydrogenase alpha subunit
MVVISMTMVMTLKMMMSYLCLCQELVSQLESQGATVLAMDCIPRMLSRGQAFDALSSQVITVIIILIIIIRIMIAPGLWARGVR